MLKRSRSAAFLMSNALMLTKRGNLVSNDYAAMLRSNYAAEVFGEAGLADVNDWVSRRTNGKIGKILDKLDSNSSAVLLNAIYFKARWASAFDRKLTRDDTFNLSSTQQITAPMMRRADEFALAAGEGYRAIRLPYEDQNLAMVVVARDEMDGSSAVSNRWTRMSSRG
jgi:serpin B